MLQQEIQHAAVAHVQLCVIDYRLQILICEHAVDTVLSHHEMYVQRIVQLCTLVVAGLRHSSDRNIAETSDGHIHVPRVTRLACPVQPFVRPLS
jgi:hypothetical protein